MQTALISTSTPVKTYRWPAGDPAARPIFGSGHVAGAGELPPRLDKTLLHQDSAAPSLVGRRRVEDGVDAREVDTGRRLWRTQRQCPVPEERVNMRLPRSSSSRGGKHAPGTPNGRHRSDGRRTGLSRALLNFASGSSLSLYEVVHVTPRQQPSCRAGPVRRGRRPGTAGLGGPGPAGSAVLPPPARSPPSVESSDRRATA